MAFASQSMRRTNTGASTTGTATHRTKLLLNLASTALPYSTITALFYAERLYYLDTTLEVAVYLLAAVLHRLERDSEVIHLLRQPIATPTPSTTTTAGRRSHQSGSKARPAIEASLRCARLYAQACQSLGRHQEGRQVLAKALSLNLPPSVPLALAEGSPFDWNEPSANEGWILELEVARLARKGGEHDRAIQGYRKVLEANAWCWEAIEGLCAEGAPPDIAALFPPRPRPRPSVSVPVSPPAPLRPLPSTSSHPPPLGPSQTYAVNSPQGFSKARGYQNGAGGEGLPFLTPSDAIAAGPTLAQPGKDKGKGVLGFTGFFSKKGSKPASEVVDMSLDDGSSFETSFPIMPMYGGTTYHGQASTSNSLFTPPTTSVFLAGAGAIPGVKRARGNQPPLSTTSSTSTATYEDESKLGRRIVRSVPDKNGRREGSLGPPRRSSRISSSSAMATSRSAQSIGSNGKVSTSTTTRDKKRPKAGAGPSVLSDAGSDALSPMSHSHSSSPVPSSPGLSHHNQPQSFAAMVDPAAQEAEDYVAGCLRSFGNAAAHAANYESSKAIEALMTLPIEQQRSPRSLLGVGKAHMEMLNYSKAEKAFNQARQMAPHLLEGMELYSTLLWHLRLPTALSYLAQDLMTIAPRSSSAWIASGNVFSHLEDHAAALKCFKRAAQLDENCVYAYTLSGHECVVLEEWERALGFFREAVRRDERHYNAWFGLGNVYMQTGKFRLAEYHFRKASQINPTNATLVCCVGSVLEKLGRRLEALELYEKACVLAPQSPAVRFKRVRILISLKQYQLAESDLLTLKNTAPNEFNVHYLLGKLYKILGRGSDMLKSLVLAQDIDPRAAKMVRDLIEKKDGMDLDEGETEEGESGMVE